MKGASKFRPSLPRYYNSIKQSVANHIKVKTNVMPMGQMESMNQATLSLLASKGQIYLRLLCRYPLKIIGPVNLRVYRFRTLLQ